MKQIGEPLLAWFAENRRVLPFRQDPSPYHIWVSEIMLQQTRMTAAVPYYERFVAELPSPAALASCPPERLKKLWQGLGYYSRAANLQKAAKVLCEQYGGSLPADFDALRALPGIGDYTAGAIASIGFGLPVVAVDGNVLRVFARLYNDTADITLPATKRRFATLVQQQQPPAAPGDFNQALMELGALVCLPNGAPQCESCPLRPQCDGCASGKAETLPVKPPKKQRPVLPVTVALVRGPKGLLLQQRPARGLLAGLWQPVAWENERLNAHEVEARLTAMGLVLKTTPKQGRDARHVFTHRVWELTSFLCETECYEQPTDCRWAGGKLPMTEYAVPSAFQAFFAPGER